MDELNERDLFRVRLRFLDLVKSFFADEPDAEKMSRWRGTFSALAMEQVSPEFDKAVVDISKALSEKKLEELQEEYYKLFVNPFDGEMVKTTASFYLNGRNFDQALVDIRGLMAEAGLQKGESVTDPEDTLVIMLDTFESLVEEEKMSSDEGARLLQKRMLEEFLDPFIKKFSEALENSQRADFYYICSRVLRGYIDLEKNLVVAV